MVGDHYVNEFKKLENPHLAHLSVERIQSPKRATLVSCQKSRGKRRLDLDEVT